MGMATNDAGTTISDGKLDIEENRGRNACTSDISQYWRGFARF